MFLGIAGIVCVAIIDLLALDLWQVVGQVRSETQGFPIADAWVLADFRGERPLVVIPIPGHPTHRTSVCAGSRMVKTDSVGRFRISMWSPNRMLAAKHASLMVFHPGLLLQKVESDMTSSIFGAPEQTIVSLSAPSGSTSSYVRYIPELTQSVSPAELQSSDEVLSLVDGFQSSCGLSSAPFKASALARLLKIAVTFEERERVRGLCKRGKTQTESLRSGKTLVHKWHRFFESDVVWPFDCSDLHFELKPSQETLLLEDRLRTTQ